MDDPPSRRVSYGPPMAPNPLLVLPTMAADLDRVEQELRRAVEAEDSFLTEVASHLILAGGKRIRPGFTILAASALAPEPEAASLEAVLGGVAVELVHLGSLYHDDVMDEALTRRTVESVNARWGNLKAILAGDYLLARASEIAASLGTEVAGLLANTIARLCEGQVRELQDAYNVDRTEEHYLQSIDGKTAALLATACRIGGIVAGLPRPAVDALTHYGHRYGMAFQVVDDILDIVATDEQLGKPSGNDLVEGTYTLPVIRVLRTPAGEELRHLLGRPLDDAEREKARDLVIANGGIEAALDVARTHLAEAHAALASVGSSPSLGAFGVATDHLVERVAEVAR